MKYSWLLAPAIALTSLAASIARAAPGETFDPAQAFPDPASAPRDSSQNKRTALHFVAEEEAGKAIDRQASVLSPEHRERFRNRQGPKIEAAYQAAAASLTGIPAKADSTGEKLVIDLGPAIDALKPVSGATAREDLALRIMAGIVLEALGGEEALKNGIRAQMALNATEALTEAQEAAIRAGKSGKPEDIAAAEAALENVKKLEGKKAIPISMDGETLIFPAEAQALLEKAGFTAGRPGPRAEHGTAAPAAAKERQR